MKIRLIELFGGIGAQAKALENLNIDFEHYKMCDFDKYAVKSYNAVHGTNFEPSDITKIKAEDLEINETDKYTYIMTYSFPCTDLSIAGKQQGMSKESGTRSGLLWHVERILKEIIQNNGELPQILLMENVPMVHGKKNINDFNMWCDFLKSIGYKNFWKDLNAKDYGIPQSRNRCYMVSILNFNGEYEFPQSFELKNKLSDFLENNVDEKFYISDKMLGYLMGENQKESKFNRNSSFIRSLEKTNKDGIATTITTLAGQRPFDNFIIIKNQLIPIAKSTKHYILWKQKGLMDSDCRAWNTKYYCGTITTNAKIKIFEKQNLKQKLCNQLILNGLVKKYDVIRHSYSNSRMKNMYIQNKRFHNCCPTLDTRCDCLGVVLDFAIRKLTPKECWRLMGFDDASFEKASKVNSNAQLYKQAGNSIVVNVLMEIFKNLFMEE